MQATLDDIRLAIRGLALAVSGAKEPLLELASIAVAGGSMTFVQPTIVVMSSSTSNGLRIVPTTMVVSIGRSSSPAVRTSTRGRVAVGQVAR